MNVEGELKNHNPAKINYVRLFKLRCKDGVRKVLVKEKSLQVAAHDHHWASNIIKTSEGALRVGRFAEMALPYTQTQLEILKGSSWVSSFILHGISLAVSTPIFLPSNKLRRAKFGIPCEGDLEKRNALQMNAFSSFHRFSLKLKITCLLFLWWFSLASEICIWLYPYSEWQYETTYFQE